MSQCPLNKPCDKPKALTLLLMHGKVEETIRVCKSCPLARQINATNLAEAMCAVCKTDLNEITSGKRVGCEFCYLFMSEKMRSLIKKVQDGATKHVGKKPQCKDKLLQKFFNYAIKKYADEHPEETKTCDDLKKLLTRYF